MVERDMGLPGQCVEPHFINCATDVKRLCNSGRDPVRVSFPSYPQANRFCLRGISLNRFEKQSNDLLREYMAGFYSGVVVMGVAAILILLFLAWWYGKRKRL
jgi:hypothetical protein